MPCNLLKKLLSKNIIHTTIDEYSIGESIFESISKDYTGFDRWFKEVQLERRNCFTIEDEEKKLKRAKELKDLKIINSEILRYTRKFFKKAKIVTFETESDATSEVLNGKADAMVYDQPYNVVFMSDKGKDKLVHLDTSLTYEPLGFAIRKGDPDFLNWLNNFIRQSKEDKVVGFSDELYNKWLVDTSWLQRVQ